MSLTGTAYRLVQDAIANGTLVPAERCAICGGIGNVIAHHDDYLKPLDVRWMHYSCHVKHHKDNGPALNHDNYAQLQQRHLARRQDQMTKDVAVIQQPVGSYGIAEYNPQKAIMQLAQSKAIIQHIMKAVMIGPTQKNTLGVHYGVIPGTPKPTLFKAGSEMILSTFRIAVDAEVEDLSTDDCIRYRVKAIGRLPDGSIVGYGVGECSTDEEKYRWKKPACETEFNNADPTRKRLKWGKGSAGKADYSVQQIRTNPADLANTVLKMAKKRAQIDLTLTATGASDVFDQDLEDLKDYLDVADQPPAAGKGKPEVQQPAATSDQGGGQENGQAEKRTYPAGDKIRPGGAKIVREALLASGVTEREFCAHMNITSVDDLLSGDMTRGMNAIKKGEIPALSES